jgi:protoporphyrinogen/coproporphyrinogen III oxidase
MQRRDFIAKPAALAFAGAAGWSVPFAAGAATAVQPVSKGTASGVPGSVLGRFDDVDRFDVVHALRDGRVPMPTEPTDECDVAIVGGGLSGLVAAQRLEGRRVIVLEKETELGGNSRSREMAGCRYALGAFLSQGAIPPFTDFLRATQAPFEPVPAHQHALHQAGRLVRDPLGAGLQHLPWPAEDRAALATAIERLAPLADPVKGLTFPMENGSAEQRAYDRRTLWAQYEAESLPPRVRQLFDTLLGARVADSGEELSGWYGSYLLANLLVPSFTMRGGHGAYSEKIAAALAARQHDALRTGFTVLQVAPRGSDHVLVTGVDAGGKPQAIAARCAVIAAPKHLAKHLVPSLRQSRGTALARYRYNAYLVAQVMLKQRVEAPFETVAPDARRARFVVAPDALPGNARRDGGGLLTIYSPQPRVAGRVALLQAEAQALAQEIAADLHTVLPQTRGAIEEVVLHRWGHPMLTATPGMGPALTEANEPEGRIVFAHSDNVGLTGLYSAVWAGMSAHTDAELILS